MNRFITLFNLLCLTFLLLFTSPLVAQDISKDYLVFTKTTGYPRRILMPLNQKINIHLKVYQKLSRVYLIKIRPNNLVLNDGRVISFDLIDRISGRTFVINNDKNFGKFMVGLGVAATIGFTGLFVWGLTNFSDDTLWLAGTGTGILIGVGLISLGIKIRKGRKTFRTNKWNLSVQLGV